MRIGSVSAVLLATFLLAPVVGLLCIALLGDIIFSGRFIDAPWLVAGVLVGIPGMLIGTAFCWIGDSAENHPVYPKYRYMFTRPMLKLWAAIFALPLVWTLWIVVGTPTPVQLVVTQAEQVTVKGQRGCRYYADILDSNGELLAPAEHLRFYPFHVRGKSCKDFPVGATLLGQLHHIGLRFVILKP